jgi:hypothetical protein
MKTMSCMGCYCIRSEFDSDTKCFSSIDTNEILIASNSWRQVEFFNMTYCIARL